MRQIEDATLIEALEFVVLRTNNKPVRIMESCNLYHFYFEKTSFSYSKSDIIRLLYKGAS